MEVTFFFHAPNEGEKLGMMICTLDELPRPGDTMLLTGHGEIGTSGYVIKKVHWNFVGRDHSKAERNSKDSVRADFSSVSVIAEVGELAYAVASEEHQARIKPYKDQGINLEFISL